MSSVTTPQESTKRAWTLRMTSPRVALLAMAGLGFGVAVYRLIFGLGAATNLSDRWPWGLWVWWDVLTGVALAGGGCSTALLLALLARRGRGVLLPLPPRVGAVCVNTILRQFRKKLGWYQAPTQPAPYVLVLRGA